MYNSNTSRKKKKKQRTTTSKTQFQTAQNYNKQQITTNQNELKAQLPIFLSREDGCLQTDKLLIHWEKLPQTHTTYKRIPQNLNQVFSLPPYTAHQDTMSKIQKIS